MVRYGMAGGDTQGELVQDLVYYKASLRLAFKHPMCLRFLPFLTIIHVR